MSLNTPPPTRYDTLSLHDALPISLVHIIAAKAMCFKEAGTEEFRKYIQQVVRNAKVLAARIASRGFRIVSGGTDTQDRKSTRLNSSHLGNSYADFCLKKNTEKTLL